MLNYKVYKLINQNIIPLVIDIRRDLSDEYDIINGEITKNYAGLCDIASCRIIKKLREKSLEAVAVHGEQRHNWNCPSSKWCLQHTWVKVLVDSNTTIYIDCTCQQFSNIYNDIPDFYVSTIEPKWFYDDRKNPTWNGITHKINEKIGIKYKVKTTDGHKYEVKDGLIEFIQYNIWGYISDIIRSMRKWSKNEKFTE